MKLLIVAVGHRMPAWVQAGFDEFARRMPRELPLQLVEVKAEPRSGGKTVEAMMAASVLPSMISSLATTVPSSWHQLTGISASYARPFLYICSKIHCVHL